MIDAHDLSVVDAARILGVHTNTIRNYIRSGRLQARSVPSGRGTAYRIPRHEVERLLTVRRPVPNRPSLALDARDRVAVVAMLVTPLRAYAQALFAQSVHAHRRLVQLQTESQMVSDLIGPRPAPQPSVGPTATAVLYLGIVFLVALITFLAGARLQGRALPALRSPVAGAPTALSVPPTTGPSHPDPYAGASNAAVRSALLEQKALSCACDPGLSRVETGAALQNTLTALHRLQSDGSSWSFSGLPPRVEATLVFTDGAIVVISDRSYRLLRRAGFILVSCHGSRTFRAHLIRKGHTWKVDSSALVSDHSQCSAT